MLAETWRSFFVEATQPAEAVGRRSGCVRPLTPRSARLQRGPARQLQHVHEVNPSSDRVCRADRAGAHVHTVDASLLRAPPFPADIFPTGEHDAYLGSRLSRSAQASGYGARRDRHGRQGHRSIHDQCSRPRRPAAARQAAGRDVSTRVEDAQALILNRTTSTSRVPSSAVRCSTHSCSAAPFENGTMGRSGKMGRCVREMGRLCSEAHRETTNDRMKSAGTALDSYNIYLSGSVPAVFQR